MSPREHHTSPRAQHTSPRAHEEPVHAPVERDAGDAGSALIETTLHEARITHIHPSRLEMVGDGQIVRIDHHGVTRQRLSGVRLALPMPPESTTDGELQRVLASWAGGAMPLRVQDRVRSGERFSRVVEIADVDGLRATLGQGDGPAPA